MKYPYYGDNWFLDSKNTINVIDIQPNHRIAFHVPRWNGGLYKMQVARVEHENGIVRIKAGQALYNSWSCSWHIMNPHEKVYLLGSNPYNPRR